MLSSRLLAGVSLLLFAAAPLVADPLSDLRAVLQRFPAKSPFAVSASVQVNTNSQDVAGVRGGSTDFEAELGSGGLIIHVPPGALDKAGHEAEKKKRNPENPTPTRTAMVALTLFDVIDALDSAAMILNELEGATLSARTPSTHAGKSAILLEIKVKPTLAGAKSRFVNQPDIDLRVWINGSGVPVAAERDSTYSASFLFVKGENVRKENWEIAISGDRLYASRADEEDRTSVVGKKIITTRSVTYTPK